MADLSSLLAVIEHDPDDAQALEALSSAAQAAPPDARASRFAQARKTLAAKGRPDQVVFLLDVELAATTDVGKQADLLIEKGMALEAELLDVRAARDAYAAALEKRPGDSLAKEAVEEIDVAQANWEKFAAKYVKEASGSTDRSLATSLYVSAAEIFVKFAPAGAEAEQHLRKALEIDPRNGKAAFHLIRLLRRARRWPDLGELLDERAERAATTEEKVAALIELSQIARMHLGNAARADRAVKRALVIDPTHPTALRWVTDAAAAAGDWNGVVAAYQAALKARHGGDDLGMLLQISMALWKHIGDVDQAEEYFRRVRKLDGGHPAALDFYRAYYTARGESGKLMSLLKQAEKGAPRARSESGEKSIGIEIAELAEAQNNPEKAIEAWKQHLRQDPTSTRARGSLARLYRRTEKWNALLDLMKDEIERLPESDVAGRTGRLFEVVEIYRDKLRLDVMVINTYNAILKLDPENQRATEELAAKFRTLGRWNDLIAILARRAEAPNLPDAERVKLLREVADLWAERFGNLANAIKPLERIAELTPTDTDAITRLKEIYTKRRQWRALIDVLGREASVLPPAERRAKQGEMARLAAERLGDTRLAIEIYNRVLAEGEGGDVSDALVALAGLYDRDKRYLALAEILHRQRAAAKNNADAIALLEKLGQVYAERLSAPQQAAAAWKEILELAPNHAKALRTLRELYATAGDFAGLESLYAKLGQEEELVEALLGIADRIEAKATRLPLVERAAQLAQKRAEIAKEGTQSQALEKARQVWERVLAVEPHHPGAAAALAPIYTKQEKWARLLSVFEIELVHAKEPVARLAKIAQIRQLSEQKLASRTLAFQWSVKAFELDPSSEALYTDVLRLAHEPDHWREVVAAFERALAGNLGGDARLRVQRELAKIARLRLADPERARSYHRKVLEIVPGDRDAEGALEDLAIQLADWPELLASYRRRAAREEGAAKAQLLVDIAALQEEKLVDLDGAAETYREALQVAPGGTRVLRALARIEEARGDWESLADVLAQELGLVADGQPRFDLLMRLGALEEQHLQRTSKALGYFRDALGVSAVGGGVRGQALAAVTRYLAFDGPGAKLSGSERVGAARLVLPHLEKARQFPEHALALEVIRAAEDTSAAEKLAIDRALMRIYHIDLGDPAAAWTAGLRVLGAEPTDGEIRRSLAVLAGQLGRDGEWLRQLAGALATLKGANAPAPQIRAVATELAQLAGDRLGDRATAERAWLAVLEVDREAADAFDALIAHYRAEQRWSDLRGILEARAEVTTDPRQRLQSVLGLALLEEDILKDTARAASAYRRVLELDASNATAYASLDRIYESGQAWTELEALLANQLEHVSDPVQQVDLQFRRAELFAHKLNDASRAVDLAEDVLARRPAHADVRELLEELLPIAVVTMRVARLLEPLYEREGLWRDLVMVLRAQRKLVAGVEAVEMLARIAVIEERELSGARNAFEAWLDVLRLDSTHDKARTELVRLAQWLGRWPEAIAALESAVEATPAADVTTRVALLGDLASYYDTQGDGERAIAAYRRLLDTDPASPATARAATAALARLYEEEEAWPELRDAMRKQAEWAEAVEDRRALLARVASLEEDELGERDAAIATWRDVLADSAGDASALHALERLYLGAERWRDLIDVLRAKLDIANDADATSLLGRIAEIHEQRLAEPEDAIAAWLEVVDREPDNRRALTELARLYRASERGSDLLDVLDRQVQVAQGPEAMALHVEIARLLGGPLSRPVEALDRWALVLRAQPTDYATWPTALAAVETALRDPDMRVMAAEILRPVYANSGQVERLAELARLAADWSEDPGTKLRALLEVVRLRERQLGDKQGAFAAQLEALKHAATEPELPVVVAETERLAGELGREADLIDAYRVVAPDVLDAEVQRRLYLDIADLSRAIRRDMDTARDYYQKVLDGQPDDRRALAALESIYRDTNDTDRLVEILLRQASSDSSADVDDRVGSLLEAAAIYKQLGRHDEAIATWEQVIELAPERGDAIYALETLYSEQGRWRDVVELYERRLGFVTSIEEAVALRVQLGELLEKQLHDVDAAIDNYAAALGGNQRHPAAISALERHLNDPEFRAQAAEVLEPIYVTQNRWIDLVRVYEAKLDTAQDPNDRLRLTRFVARLYEEQLEDFENASRWYARLFREAPSDPAVRDQLQRLGSIVENWTFVAETYQGYLDDETGDTEEVREVAIAVAAIYDRRLGNIDQSFAAYRRALGIEIEDAVPSSRELVRRLEDLLGRSQRWNELVTIYEDIISRTDGDMRRDALTKRARLFEDGLHDASRAIDAWRDVVMATEDGATPAQANAYREAVGELERLYRVKNQWHDLVDLCEARMSRAQDPNETAELRLKLADVFETQVKDLQAALDQYEHVIAEGRQWERAVASLERLVVHEQHRERIAEILEPVYREQDWWQKLVVILDAKLQFVQDPIEQVAILQEIATIHEDRGGALDLALQALARAWRIDVSDDDSLAKLIALAARLDAWDDAVKTIEEGATSAADGEHGATLWARAAEIHEAQRGDLERAVAAWRKVDEARPDDLIALAALDRLLAVQGRVDELVVVVARRAELTDDAGVRLVLLHRVAALYEEVLNDRTHAIEAYKNVLGVDDTDLAALDALERLYQTGTTPDDARELAQTLERKIELTADLSERQQLRHAAAGVYEQQLSDKYQAIGQLTAILEDDAVDARALAELDRIYGREKMWPELLDIVDRRALLAISARDRADLAFRAAHIVEHEMGDPEAAIPRYGAVLQVLATHEGARSALESLMAKDDFVEGVTPLLERVYRAEREPAGLIRVYERRLAAADRDAVARRADWQALADVREKLANQPTQAFVVWGRALADEPDDTELLTPLLRLAESQNLWKELAALLDERLSESAQPLPPDVEQTYAMRLGQIVEDKLGDLDRAARAYDRAAGGPEPRPALAALERVQARAAKWGDLASTLRRESEAAEEDAHTAEFLYRLGDLLETTLHDARGAVGAYRDVLGIDPAHARSRAALERMIQSAPEQRSEIVEILEPLFEQDGDFARLAMVLEARLVVIEDSIEQASLLSRLAEIAEHKLNDRGRALDAAMRWLAIDPASQQALGETQRLSERLGQWRETAQRLDQIVRAPDASEREPDVQVALLVMLGNIQRDRIGAPDDAIRSYRAALALEAGAIEALDPLIEILRVRSEWAPLAEALRQKGALAAELPEKRAAYAEVAQLCERAGDLAGAITAWGEVSDLDDNDRDALDQLARIYRGSKRAEERSALIDVLGRAARIAANAEDEKDLRVEIAQLEGDGPRAVSAWQAVVDLEPDDRAALGELEAAHARAGDWIAVSDIQTRRLDLAESASERVAIRAEMAALAETKRSSIDDAIASWYAALDDDSSYVRAYDELERLLGAASRWHDVVDLLEKRADLYGTLGDATSELHALARAADVWESKLDNPDAAGEILEKILAREPGSVAALTRLSRIYERSGDWDRCKQTLERALGLSPKGRDAADLFFRLGEVARVGDSDDDTAIQHFRETLKHEPAHAGAIAALEKLARDRRDPMLLADMLERRVAALEIPSDRVALLVELSEIERRAGRAENALAALGRAAKDAPDDVRVLGPLADMYFAANRLDEAAPIYERLANEAKTARRMKDVARFRQRQGGILEARGDRPGALVAYEEALRVNPTDVTTMTSLGRLYFASGDWEKARKIYQSLVLQNIDAEAGVTKGEVYWALGKIHIELGQSPKAKSMFQRGLEIDPGNPKLKEALSSLS
jgi:tetratricopeptide (TPR) repeat protein